MTSEFDPATTLGQDLGLQPIEGQDVVPLTEFIAEFGDGLMAAVSRQNPPVYDGALNPVWERLMDNFKRQPFPAQRERVQAVCKLLLSGEAAAIINGDMGCGKSIMGIAAAAILHAEGYPRTLIISPPHLVYKWRREILETINDAKVWVLNGPDTLRQLIKIRGLSKTLGSQNPEFFIIGRVRMRMGFDWQPAVKARHVYQRAESLDGHGLNQPKPPLVAYRYAACPDCGAFVTDKQGLRMTDTAFVSTCDQRSQCKHCAAPLWALYRPGTPKNQDALVHAALCKIPTLGPKTADKLLQGFGAGMLGSLLSDNIHEFINLMDGQGDLVFSDRQAKRMEAALAKQEFGLGQGGYQASEFIKRYLPDGYFGVLVADEAHEFKNAGSAQGQAMGVLAAKARKTVLLTGTLMGGYCDDLFYLLWRVLPQRMLEDGYRYNAQNSLGPAAMRFMQQHGVLKDIFKETESSHKTARGKRISVQTVKAPGFGPKGVARYVLPFTAFLKLSQIGGKVLPPYQEDFIEAAMTLGQSEAYRALHNTLKDALNKALSRGDKTLLGLVLNVLLAWPDTCFRVEEVRHPRTQQLLAFVPPVFAGDEPSPKEHELVRIIKENKALGRKVLVYTVYTGKRDTLGRLKALLQAKGLKTAVLRSSVSTEAREDWILEQVDRGIDVLVCNPELVKTGLDLLDFPTLCFLQCGFNTYTVQQASRRSWRIGQQQAVKVYFLGYRQTAQIACLKLMSKKMAVSQSTSGAMPETGLDILNVDGDSIEVALAKQLLGKEEGLAIEATSKPAGWAKGDDMPKHATGRLSSAALEGELCKFTGTQQWYRHALNRQMLYTDGVKYFAGQGGGHGAYWLLDMIATEYWPLLKAEAFLAIFVKVKGHKAVIEVTDGNGHALKTHALAYTDLQEGTWKFYLTDNVLLLPSEY